MAISSVKAVINGQSYNLTLNSSTGKYEAKVTAPGKTSYHQSGGYYNVQVTATNTAGTTGTADASTLDGLKLVVKETIAPVITITSPTSGAYLSNNLQSVVFTLADEDGGSGVDISTLRVTLDGAAQSSATYKAVATASGYTVTFTPASAYADGTHTLSVSVSDFDGNAATAQSVSFIIDTVPPTLDISAPLQNLITAQPSQTVIGTTNDATSSPVTVSIVLNGADQGSVSIAADGSFSKTVTLAEGANTIIITAQDKTGQKTSVTRNVTLDTSVPRITAAQITPNPVDAGASVTISITLE